MLITWIPETTVLTFLYQFVFLVKKKKKMKGNVLSLCPVVQANCVEELLINAHRCDV